MTRRLRWLEMSPDYRCNNRCLGCFSVSDDGPSMSSAEIARTLARARERGATSLWLGGGEPTLRKDLFAVIARARALGYSRIKLQTNGMLLAYPDFTERCVRAGLTEVSFSIKGASAELHDRLTATPGCHELLIKGIAEVQARGLPMEGDILVYRSNMSELPEMVQAYAERGISRFQLWLLSSVDGQGADLSSELVRIDEVMPFVVRAMDLGLSSAPDFITSLHTPACTVPHTHRRCVFHAADLDLWVENPGGYGFFLEQSPIEGGMYTARCVDCSARSRCGGIRAEYASRHGDDEFQPI